MGTLNLQPPIGSRVTSPYGAPRKGRPHKGIDYHAHIGTAIVASETGKVVRAAFNSGGFGNVIVIDHTPLAGEGERHIYTLYAHLSSMGVLAGGYVKKGNQIGLSGDSETEDPHLHFEVIDSGTKMGWQTTGKMGFDGIEGRRNPNKYLGTNIEVKGTVVDGIRQIITDGVKNRLEYVVDIDHDRENASRIEVWLDKKIIGHFDKENSTIRLKYS
ncbi:MAG: M23 family metallopeptidase, partial [SAR324 cluster bacterium]|nr:M23 family metallopeptidase [SAR324 cluster bacterium]